MDRFDFVDPTALVQYLFRMQGRPLTRGNRATIDRLVSEAERLTSSGIGLRSFLLTNFPGSPSGLDIASAAINEGAYGVNLTDIVSFVFGYMLGQRNMRTTRGFSQLFGRVASLVLGGLDVETSLRNVAAIDSRFDMGLFDQAWQAFLDQLLNGDTVDDQGEVFDDEEGLDGIEVVSADTGDAIAYDLVDGDVQPSVWEGYGISESNQEVGLDSDFNAVYNPNRPPVPDYASIDEHAPMFMSPNATPEEAADQYRRTGETVIRLFLPNFHATPSFDHGANYATVRASGGAVIPNPQFSINSWTFENTGSAFEADMGGNYTPQQLGGVIAAYFKQAYECVRPFIAGAN